MSTLQLWNQKNERDLENIGIIKSTVVAMVLSQMNNEDDYFQNNYSFKHHCIFLCNNISKDF